MAVVEAARAGMVSPSRVVAEPFRMATDLVPASIVEAEYTRWARRRNRCKMPLVQEAAVLAETTILRRRLARQMEEREITEAAEEEAEGPVGTEAMAALVVVGEAQGRSVRSFARVAGMRFWRRRGKVAQRLLLEP